MDWEELSSFMIEMGMKGWEDETVGLPSYAYAGQVDSAQPIHAADQVRLLMGSVQLGTEAWYELFSPRCNLSKGCLYQGPHPMIHWDLDEYKQDWQPCTFGARSGKRDKHKSTRFGLMVLSQSLSQILYFAENESVVVIEPSASFFRVYDSDAMHLRRQYEIKVSGDSGFLATR